LKRAELRWNRPPEEHSARLRLPELVARALRVRRRVKRVPTPVEEL
jgi:hypothetical protein